MAKKQEQELEQKRPELPKQAEDSMPQDTIDAHAEQDRRTALDNAEVEGAGKRSKKKDE